MPSEPPLIPDPDGQPFSAQVIDIGEFRVQWGRTVDVRAKCEHRRLIYNRDERRVWCQDCERTIDGFDAFLKTVQHFEAMERKASARLKQADDALKATLTRRVTKALDRTWASGMAPGCPHCNQVLLPEDMEHVSSSNQEWVRAHRKRKAERDAEARQALAGREQGEGSEDA